MAATNYTPIQLYHSTTASAVPVNTNLVNGELAINITDGKLYYKDNGGTVQVIASKGTGTIGGSTTQVQYNLSGALAGSSNFTFNGTTATINTLNLTNALGATYGGTAQSSWTTGDLLYASGSNTLAKLGIGLNTYILTSNGSIPGWAAPSAISVNTATNLAGGAAGSVPYQSGPGATTFLSIGTANQVVTSTGSAPQWSSGLSITTLTASDAVTFSATTQNIALGTSQTSGTFTVGGTAQTGNIAIDRSTKTHTLNIGTGITESGQTKTINIGTAGDTGSTTAITIGSANGTTITVNGTVNASTLDLTNLEVTNIKAKDGTASMTLADTTGIITLSATAGTANGVLYLNGSRAVTSGSALTFDGTNLSSTGGATFQGGPTGYGGGEVRLGTAASGQQSAISTLAVDSPVLFFDHRGSGNTGVFAWRNGTGSVNELMRLTSTGLGVGQTNPGARIDAGASGGATIRISNTSTASSAFDLVGALDYYSADLDSQSVRAYVRAYFNDLFGRDAYLSFGTMVVGGSVSERARIDPSGTLILRQSSNAANTSVSFNTTVQNALTLDSSGRLGVGIASPAYQLDVQAAVGEVFVKSTTGTNYAAVQTNNTGGSFYAGLNNSANTAFVSSAYAAVLWHTGNYPMVFATNNGEKMRLDSSGNLGLGVTPSAWNTGRAIELGNVGNALWSANQIDVFATMNAYQVSGGSWRYASTNPASLFEQFNGNFYWKIAPSGTANSASVTSGASYAVVALGSSTLAQWQAFFNDSSNNPLTVTPTLGQVLTGNATGTLLGGGLVTQNISFTQAMTLLANGNLGLGVTNPVTLKSATTLQVNGNAKLGNANDRGLLSLGDIFSTEANVGVWRGAAGAYGSAGNYLCLGGYDGITFTTGASDISTQTERARITSSGGFEITGVASTRNMLQVGSANSTLSGWILGNNSAGSGGIWSTSVTPSGTNYTLLADGGTTTVNANTQILFGIANAEKARITSGGELLVAQTAVGSGGTLAVNGTISIGTTTNGTQSSMSKDGTQLTSSISTSATTIFSDLIQGMSSASAAQFLIYGHNNAGAGFVDVVVAKSSGTPVVISSSTVQGSPAARTYTILTDALQLAMASGTYSVNVRCTTMGYPF